jgi:hypothetical protein
MVATTSTAHSGEHYPKQFAIAFVVSVTEISDTSKNWIAKKGKDSLFAILQDIYPEVIPIQIQA